MLRTCLLSMMSAAIITLAPFVYAQQETTPHQVAMGITLGEYKECVSFCRGLKDDSTAQIECIKGCAVVNCR
jgi:hypothetical protein